VERLIHVVLTQVGAFFFAGGTPTSVLAGLAAGGSRLEVVVITLLLNATVLGLYVGVFTVGVERVRKYLPYKLSRMITIRGDVARADTKIGVGTILGILVVVVAPSVVVGALIARSVLWKQVSYAGMFLTYRFFLVGALAFGGEWLFEITAGKPMINLDVVIIVAVGFVLRYRMKKGFRKAR
jgi:hypothetical protein